MGGEGGGHTGDVATSILIPMVVDRCRGRKSPLTGKQVPVIAAGGIFDGRGLAMALSLGADAVWVGTRFMGSVEGGAPRGHKNDVVKASVHDTHRSLIYTGRPMRVIKIPYTVHWEDHRAEEMKKLLQEGVLPAYRDLELVKKREKGEVDKWLVPLRTSCQRRLSWRRWWRAPVRFSGPTPPRWCQAPGCEFFFTGQR